MTLARRRDRTHDELTGLCRGVLADGHVSEQEAEFLMDWIARNAAFTAGWPFDMLYTRLATILADGAMDADESADLHDTLVRFVGGEAFDPIAETASLSTALPLDDPPPAVAFEHCCFVVTGTFSYGPRKAVISAIEKCGGIVAANVSRHVNYLIVGELGSRDWAHSNAGRKIEKAMDLRRSGTALAIIGEAHFRQALP